MHWFSDYGMGFGFGGILMILFWGFLILLVLYLAKILAGSVSAGKERMETAEELLQKRFARGEISKDDFEEAMVVLRKSRI